jgi:tricorn protease
VPLDAMLQDKAGKRILLTVNAKPDAAGARDVAITAIGDDSMLRYVDWVRKNREYVAAKSDGKLAYIHVPDMGANGLTRFETWLYPQADAEGLVVDVRWNRGGFVSQLLLDKLRRPILGYNLARNGGIERYPYARRGGGFVVLTNGFAGSDGDIFPRAVQLEGLAPVLGERSWGGVIGIRGDKPLVDGGFLSQPEYAFWFKSGGWGVENNGVIPDIEVGWTPQDVAAGHDTQLDAAIAEAMKRREANPPLKPPVDHPNDKSRAAFGVTEKSP